MNNITDGTGQQVLDQLNANIDNFNTITINGHLISSDVTLNTIDIENILSVNASNIEALQNLTNINTGDETLETIIDKLKYTPVNPTRTINGHSLANDVVISASDITTGTLHKEQLPLATAYGVGAVVPDGVTTSVNSQGVLSGISGSNSSVRQTILSAGVDGNGNPNYLTSSGLTITLNASSSIPFVASLANGYGIAGNPIDIPIAVLNNLSITLPANSSLLLVTGGASLGWWSLSQYLGKLTAPPLNPSINTIYFDTTKMQTYLYNGSTWVLTSGVILATVITGASAVTSIIYNSIVSQDYNANNPQPVQGCIPYSANSGSVDGNGLCNAFSSLSGSSIKLAATLIPFKLTQPDGVPEAISIDQTITGIQEGLTTIVKEENNSTLQAIQTTVAGQDIILDFKNSLNKDLYGNTINIVGTGAQLGYDVSSAAFTAGNISTLSKVTAGNLNGVFFSSDGTKLYAADKSTSIIYQYTLSTPWVVNTAIYSNKSFNASTQIGAGNLYNMFFSTDGTKLYGTHLSTKVVYQYTLSTAWDVSTATYSSLSYTCTQVTANYFTDICFSIDGTKMYAIDASTKTVYQYTLSTAWNISTATYASLSIVIASVTANYLYDIFFSPDGTMLYAADGSTNIIYQYALGTAWNISTAVITTGRNFNTTTQVGSSKLRGIFISTDGSKLFVSDSNTTNTYQYALIMNQFLSGTSTGLNTTSITSLGTGSWIIRGKFLFNNFTVVQELFGSSIQYGFHLQATTAGKLALYLSSNGTSYDIASATLGATTLLANVLYDIALQFNGTQYQVFVGAVTDQTITSSVKVYSSLTGLSFGSYTSSTSYLIGRMTDIQVTIGRIRYVAGSLVTPTLGSLAIDRFIFTDSMLNPTAILKPANQNFLQDFKTSLTNDYHGNTVNLVGTGATIANNQFVSGTNTGLNIPTLTTLGLNFWGMEGRYTLNNFTAITELFGSMNAYAAHLQVTTAGKLALYLSSNGTSFDIANGTLGISTLSTGIQYHVALVFIGWCYIVLVNGNIDQIISSSSKIYATLTGLAFGYYAPSPSEYLNGSMTDLRVTIGSLRYTGLPFTPPTQGSLTPELQPLFGNLYWMQQSVKPGQGFKNISGVWNSLPFTRLAESPVSNGIMGTVINYGYNRKYISPDVACTGVATATVFNHNLGTNQVKATLYLRCIVAEAGFSIGDVVIPSGTNASYTVPFSPSINKNTITYTTNVSNAYAVLNKTTGVNTGLTPANWKQFVVVEGNI